MCQIIYIHDLTDSLKSPPLYAEGVVSSNFLLWFEKLGLRDLPKDPELDSGGAGFRTQASTGNRTLLFLSHSSITCRSLNFPPVGSLLRLRRW